MYLDDYVELACRVSQNRECKHIALHYSLKNVEPAEGDYELDDFAKDAIYATICTMYEQSIHDYSCYEIYYEIIIRPETGRANDLYLIHI